MSARVYQPQIVKVHKHAAKGRKNPTTNYVMSGEPSGSPDLERSRERSGVIPREAGFGERG